MILFFDTETTGLYPGQVCQLSYVMQTKESTVSKNFFFTVDYVEPGAQMVHGFSVQELARLSNGKTFSFYADEIEKDFKSADLVIAHNTAFDFTFMTKEFERVDKVFMPKQHFCSMKGFTPICKLAKSRGLGYKYPKLSELCAFLGVDDNLIQDNTIKLYGKTVGYHDARFDTVALYTAVNKSIKSYGLLGDFCKYL